MVEQKKRIHGCLIGGAIGDALGWPVEFLDIDEIKQRYGTRGITDLVETKYGIVEITDDTQMTIFTAEGILRAENRGRQKGIVDITSVVYRSYLRWLHTQGIHNSVEEDGWLVKKTELYHRRAPGNTCLSALESGKMGSIYEPINDSKGCGGVMRSAPFGLFYKKEKAFELGCEAGAITHGHPSGYLSSGALSYIVACIMEGMDLHESIRRVLKVLKEKAYHEECTELLVKAVKYAEGEISPNKAIKELGEGWVGEEALAISVYCALKYQDDFKEALITAVNHDGDSDSTGAITGNILGAYLGVASIPEDWIKKVELRETLEELGNDLHKRFEDSPKWNEKYPGW